MTYAELQQSVADYMHRSDLTDEIPGFIELARTRINRDMRVRENIITAGLTPTTNPFDAPADFMEMRDIYHFRNGSRVHLQLVGREQLDFYDNQAIQDANPRFFSIDGVQLETQPGGIDVVFTLLYYAAVPELVADDDTNLLLSVYPMTWLYGSLIEGHSFTQDLTLEETALAKYTSEVDRANDMAADSESGAALQVAGASRWF